MMPIADFARWGSYQHQGALLKADDFQIDVINGQYTTRITKANRTVSVIVYFLPSRYLLASPESQIADMILEQSRRGRVLRMVGWCFFESRQKHIEAGAKSGR